jgi:hypothetical protein
VQIGSDRKLFAVTFDVGDVITLSPNVGYSFILAFCLVKWNVFEATSDRVIVRSKIEDEKPDLVHQQR